MYQVLDELHLSSISEYGEINLREEKFEGKDCYVLKRPIKEYMESYEEIWIEKDTNLVIRDYKKYGEIYSDEVYTYEIGSVKDEVYQVDDKVFYEVLLESADNLKNLYKSVIEVYQENYK